MRRFWLDSFRLGLAALSAVGFGQARAENSIWLEPDAVPIPPAQVRPGDEFSIDLKMDFSADKTIGGGLDVQFDPDALAFVSFTFNSSFPTDPAFTRQPDVRAGGVLNSLAFGNFNGISSGTVGTFKFKAVHAGTSNIELLVDGRPGDTESIAGPFYSAVNSQLQQVNFKGAVITVVPEPEVWGMMLAGVGIVGWRARSRARVLR